MLHVIAHSEVQVGGAEGQRLTGVLGATWHMTGAINGGVEGGPRPAVEKVGRQTMTDGHSGINF